MIRMKMNRLRYTAPVAERISISHNALLTGSLSDDGTNGDLSGSKDNGYLDQARTPSNFNIREEIDVTIGYR